MHRAGIQRCVKRGRIRETDPLAQPLGKGMVGVNAIRNGHVGENANQLGAVEIRAHHSVTHARDALCFLSFIMVVYRPLVPTPMKAG